MQPFSEIKQTSTIWFNLRTHMRLTSSNMGRALGVDPNESRMSYWKRKVLKTPEPAKSEFVQACLEHGIQTEPIAIDKFWTKFGPYNRMVHSPGLFLYPKDVSICASPDGLLYDKEERLRAVIEIKCPYVGNWWQAEPLDVFTKKPQYYLQIQIQMQCCEVRQGYFYIYVAPTEEEEEIDRVFIVKRDDTLWTNLYTLFNEIYEVAQAKEFGKLRMKKGEKPEIMAMIQESVIKNCGELC